MQKPRVGDRPVPVRFVARRAELRRLESLLVSAAAGRGGALVMDGEAGMGKSTLIDTAVGRLDGFEVLRAAGAEFEQDLLYAVLHQLCAPVLEYRSRLPEVQREALEAVFGLGVHISPDPLTVNLAVLGLLNEAAGERPVCCVVDDAQWIDEASRRVLIFVARRVAGDRIAMVFAARDVRSLAGFVDLPRLTLTGLGHEDARALLDMTAHVGVNDEVFDRILAEARGNPLALHEFAHEAEPFGVTRPRRIHVSVLEALEQRFAQRFGRLPDATRLLVVLAAAEPVGDLALLRRAARLLEADAAGLVHAENAGLLALGPRLRFRHPLVRSVVYASATSGTRRQVHGALAQATDAETDPDRRAWHRAHAVVDADEHVAAELENSADRAYGRGGFAAAAAFMERAGQLTPAHDRKVERLLAGARLRLLAGAPAAARELVAEAERHHLGARARAAADLLRARIDFQFSHTPEATTTLVDVVGRSAPAQAPETYLEAFASFMYNEHRPGRLRELALRIREQSRQDTSVRPCELLLDGLLDQTLLPAARAVPAMRAAARSCRAAPRATGPWRNLLCQLVIDLRDDEAMEEIPDHQVDVARRQGALASLPQALRYQAIARISVGLFDEATAMLMEARHIDEAAGTPPLVGAELVHAGFRGDVDRFRELQTLLGHSGRPFEIAGEHYASAVLNNGLGNYEEALGSALAAQRRHQAGSYTIWAVYSELVEAAARAGRGEEAAAAMHHLETLARANPLPWAVAEWRQAQALLGHDADREGLHRAAIDAFAKTRVRVLHARARLTYGEWLRRENRRAEARTELRAAHEMLSGMGADAFAERAGRELRATGASPRRQGAGPSSGLTAQERIVAERVASGATSREVGAMLFLSPRTVDTHLRNVYRKLGISSRRELRGISW
ncbi:AAA family ATPase [Streptomyces sp. LP05-1]|uniref:AAA family ATPase n=1 Tax=Streptomyces pyxinae TaxID=2970734 RepID=A0ABT2CJE2_9ACTN|nr:LuxR family transcriptional regulator [Streptomyces sp. LP05-1]MCS0637544.1 AAA family ATPase [Streptomyces sp. LP05-1]